MKKRGRTLNKMYRLPDGSGCALVSFPLPKSHWLYKNGTNESPMPFRMGTSDRRRKAWTKKIYEAGKFAIRAATQNGKDMEFDPDALLQNFVVGLLGYHTPDGRRHYP